MDVEADRVVVVVEVDADCVVVVVEVADFVAGDTHELVH